MRRLLITLLLGTRLFAQTTAIASNQGNPKPAVIGNRTIAAGASQLPAAASCARCLAVITDALNATDTTVGGGTTIVFAFSNGSAWIAINGGGAAVWGGVTGTLSNQTDLQSALNGKAASNASTTVAGQGCALGGSCSVASTNLSDSSSLVRTSDTATVTNTMLAGSIANAKLANSSTTVAGQTCTLGSSCTVASTNLSDSSSIVRTTDTGTVTNAMLAGSIANAKLSNSSVTVNSTTCTLGSSCTLPGQLHTISFVIDGGGAVVNTGDIKFYPPVNYACTINRVDVSADQSGSVTVDVWKANNAIPTSSNKISASAPITLSSAQLSENGSLTGWTTGVSAGDVFGFSVASATTVQRVYGVIWCQ